MSIASFPDGPSGHVQGPPAAAQFEAIQPQGPTSNGGASGALSDLLGLEGELSNIQKGMQQMDHVPQNRAGAFGFNQDMIPRGSLQPSSNSFPATDEIHKMQHFPNPSIAGAGMAAAAPSGPHPQGGGKTDIFGSTPFLPPPPSKGNRHMMTQMMSQQQQQQLQTQYGQQAIQPPHVQQPSVQQLPQIQPSSAHPTAVSSAVPAPSLADQRLSTEENPLADIQDLVVTASDKYEYLKTVFDNISGPQVAMPDSQQQTASSSSKTFDIQGGFESNFEGPPTNAINNNQAFGSMGNVRIISFGKESSANINDDVSGAATNNLAGHQTQQIMTTAPNGSQGVEEAPQQSSTTVRKS